MPTANDVLYCAQQWIGYSRWTDPEEGTVFGRWYAEKTGDSYYGASGVPYCAMFASYCLDWAGVSAPGMPGAYVPWILDAGYENGTMVYNEDAQPGDLVMFDWGGDGVADHIGIVEENHPDEGWMQTIEGNTSSGTSGSQSNGGGVYRRARSYSSIIGISRPWYGVDEEPGEPEAPAEPTPEEIEQARVDGLPEALKKYSDLYPSEWYIACVNSAVEQGLMRGTSDSTFEPYETLTRAMAIAVIANKLKADVEPLPFTDIAEWYTATAIWAEKQGIITGNGGEMRPNDGCTRQEFVVMLWRSQGKPEADIEPDFEDWGDVADWAQDAMKWAIDKKIIGNGGNLRPNDICSRAECASMVTKF